MKQCTRCKKLKDESEFGKNHKNKDGLQIWCKKCKRECQKRNYRRNKSAVKKYFSYEESHRTIDGVKQKRCTKCKKWKDGIQFTKNNRNKDGLSLWCKDCVRAYTQERCKKKGKGLKKYYRYEECHRVVDGVKQKLCRKCKRWKIESQYYKQSRHKDGLAGWCKECANKATNAARRRRLATSN